ncbi:MAG: uncharacterized protein JWL77_3502 [Chthonomonadaceae bacterium]|nr:uncharacterized protein [Chthonomonadaceae bacterium]
MQRKHAIGMGMLVGVGIVVGGFSWSVQQIRQREVDRQRLFRAIEHDDTATVRALLESGVDANMRLRMGVPLGLVDLIKITLHVRPQSSTQEHDTSALIAAALRNQDPEIVRLLVAHGANVNAMVDGWTPLTVALDPSNGRPRLDVVQFLLEHGADPNLRSAVPGIDGPLFYALGGYRQNVDLGPLTKLLLDHGADPMQTERGGRTYLTSEVWASHTKTVAAMLDHGADINARDKDNEGITGGSGTTPLAAAISTGHIVMLKMLLARGATRWTPA